MTATERLLDLDGIGQRQSTVRFDVLYQAALTVPIGTITPIEQTVPTVAVDTASTISRTLSNLRLTPTDQAFLDPFAHRLRPVWILENGVEFPLGVFVCGSMDRIRYEYGLGASVSAVDQGVIVDQPMVTSVSVKKGESVTAKIVALLTGVVPNIDVDELNATVESPIAWPAGTSRLEIVNALAALGSAFPLYFTNTGVARVRAVTAPAAEIPSLVYDAGGRIRVDSMVETDDLLTAPNRYLVIDSGNPDLVISAVYDIPDTAPNSFVNRGYYVTEVISVQGLPPGSGYNSAAWLRARAEYEAAGGGYQSVAFSSPPDPRHDVLDPVGYLGTTYREVGWSLPLAEGATMSHRLRLPIPAVDDGVSPQYLTWDDPIWGRWDSNRWAPGP